MLEGGKYKGMMVWFNDAFYFDVWGGVDIFWLGCVYDILFIN